MEARSQQPDAGVVRQEAALKLTLASLYYSSVSTTVSSKKKLFLLIVEKVRILLIINVTIARFTVAVIVFAFLSHFVSAWLSKLPILRTRLHLFS